MATFKVSYPELTARSSLASRGTQQTSAPSSVNTEMKRQSVQNLGENGVRSFLFGAKSVKLECKDPKVVGKDIFMFYSELYSTKYSEIDCNTLFNDISTLIPKIETTFKEDCDADLIIEELDAAIMKMASNKSPGSDGLC
ncbi:hypothetical protein AMECASPLE_030065 [Ameca splendens]|uniref:Uncharacterized protein n=1 Tax=Ameca splendens TaxID=208324 RepID=A0ABV0XUT8_9TELE